MTGLRRPIPSKFVAVAIFGALAVSMNGLVHAEQRKGAPIKYMGQGSAQSSLPIEYAYHSSSARSQTSTALPAYGQPVNRSTEPENPRTKRIEFRYPDQPHVIHGSDGSGRQGQGDAIEYSLQKQAVAVHPVSKVAAVNQPTSTVPQKSKAPILHQPAYKRPAIEETVMNDIVPAIANPATKSAIVEPIAQPRFDATGIASWYGEAYHGQPTANGEIFDMNALSAAHPTLPLPSLVQVKNLENGREVVVRVNDRGPFVPNRMIDMSKRAADELGFLVAGETKVSVRYLGPAPVANELAGQGSAPFERAPERQLPPTRSAAVYDLQPKMDPIPNPASPVYFIQAGSFAEMANAQRLSGELSGSLPVDVVLANVNGADFFRVLIGPYSSRSVAAAMRDQLDVSGIVSGVLITGQN